MEWFDLLQYLPVSLILIMLTTFGLHHLCFSSLKSPTNFQQGVTEISLFRSAINCTLVVIAPLIFILPASSAELIIHYLFGYGCAATFSILLISPVLHYNPSPSICHYIKLRFNQSFLYILVCILNVIFLTMLAVVLLVTTVSLITRISLLSPYKICTTLGYISLFAIAFGGQTSVSSNIFFASTCLTVLGIICMVFDGVTYYFLDIILSGDYLSFDSWTAFYLGILNGLHLLTTSPLLYQQYFSLSSCRRLRESQIIHIGLFCILTGAILMSPNFFPNKINSFCPGSLPVFSNVTLENKFQETIGSSLITTLLALITSFGIIFTLLALTNLIWEDLLRPWLVRRPLQQQLGLLQIGLLIIGSVIIAISNMWLYLDKPLRHEPLSLLILSTLVTPMTALYTCSYIFPFLNGKGATVGLLIGILGAVTLFYLYFRIMPLRFHHYSKPCLNETSVTYSWLWPDCKFANSDLDFVPVILQEMIRKAQKVPSILCEVPVTWYPLATFTITSLSMLLVSLCTSGNFNEFDYRLIICPPYIRIATRHADNINNHKGVAFVECESFRYAQQTPYPDTVVSVTNAIR